MKACCFPQLFLMVSLAVFATSLVAQAQPTANSKVTTVYLLRHAEKDSASTPSDPTLSAVGQVRAEALRPLLARRYPAALFTTDTRRTRATLAPLAAATHLEPLVYDPQALPALAARIRTEYIGKEVVVVGHANTLLPLIEALGGTSPIEEIRDDEYDYLFTVRMTAGALPTVAVRGYGPERRPATSGRPAHAPPPR